MSGIDIDWQKECGLVLPQIIAVAEGLFDHAADYDYSTDGRPRAGRAWFELSFRDSPSIRVSELLDWNGGTEVSEDMMNRKSAFCWRTHRHSGDLLPGRIADSATETHWRGAIYTYLSDEAEAVFGFTGLKDWHDANAVTIAISIINRRLQAEGKPQILIMPWLYVRR